MSINPFAKINTREEAKKIVDEGVKGFYVLAAIQFGVGIFLGFIGNDFSTVFDGILLFILAFLLKKYIDRPKLSKALAFGLLIITSFAIFTTFGNKLGGDWGGGQNIILAIIALYIGIITVRGTLVYHTVKGHRDNSFGLIALLIGGAFLVLFAIGALSSTSPDESIGGTSNIQLGGNKYPDNIRNNFISSCIASGDGYVTRNHCTCLLEYIESKYSLTEFNRIEQEYTKTQQFPPDIDEATARCIK